MNPGRQGVAEYQIEKVSFMSETCCVNVLIVSRQLRLGTWEQDEDIEI